MRRFEEVFTKSHHLHSIKTSRSTEYDRLLGQLFYLCSSYSHYASAMPQGQSWPSCPGVRTERQRVADSSQSGRQHLELPLCHLQISPDISRYLQISPDISRYLQISPVFCAICATFMALCFVCSEYSVLWASRKCARWGLHRSWTGGPPWFQDGVGVGRSRAAAVADSLWCERTYAKDDAMQALAKKIDTLVFKFMLVSQKCLKWLKWLNDC